MFYTVAEIPENSMTMDQIKNGVETESIIVCFVYDNYISFLTWAYTDLPGEKFEERTFWFGDLFGRKHSKTAGWKAFWGKVRLSNVRIFTLTNDFLDYVYKNVLTIKA